MNIIDYKKSFTNPLRQATLCFLIKGDQVLLAMKKRGFAVGKFNGIGGKKNDDETIENTAIRETQEEINIAVTNLVKKATLKCYFHDNPEWGQQVSVFLVSEWSGEPVETEEMNPQWFNKKDIPFEKMWPDEKLWLPLVLEGKNVEAEFMFDKNESIIDQVLQVLP